jgi:hypothetical protein
MTSRRDIELLISARDQTGRTLPTLTKNIADLSAKLAEQTLAAERGEVSLKELEQTQRSLAQAAKELVQQQNLIDTFKRQSDAMALAEANAEKLGNEYATLKAQLAGAETVTAGQERALARLEKQSTTAATAFQLTKTNLAATAAAMEQAGISTAALDRQQAQLVQSATEVGTSLKAADTLIGGYEAQIQSLTAAERAAAGVQIGDQRLAEANKLRQAAEYTRFWTQALDTLEASEQQLAATNAFRRVGTDAVAAAQDISRFVQAGATMPAATSGIAAGLRAIVEPGRAAISTLSGLEAEISSAAAVAGTEKLRVSEYSDALNRLSQASAELLRQGSLVDSFRDQAAAVDIARAKFDQAAAEVQQYGRAVAAAEAPNEQLAATLRRAETTLAATGRELVAEETKLGQMSRALKQAGIDTHNLTVEQQRLSGAANQVAAASGKLNSTLGRNGATPNKGFLGLGLNPYEMQNLTFQINDVVSGLLSGQKPLQVFLQQGTQITQIIPGAASAIAKFALRFAPLIAAVGATVAVLGELDSDIDRIKRFQTALSANVDGGLYDPAKLAAVSEGLEIMGVKAEDAEKAVSAFVKAGADAGALEGLVETAKNMSEVMGIDLPAATDLLISVMNGGYDAAVALDQQMNLLTATELEHVKALYDSGNAQEARQYIFDRAGRAMDDLAARNRSIWQVAANNFRGAWNSLLGKLGETGIVQRARGEINSLSAGVAVLAALLNGKSLQEARAEANAALNITSAAAQRAQSFRSAMLGIAGERQRQQKIDQDYIANIEEADQLTRKLSRSETVRLKGLKALRDAQKAGVSDEAARRAQEIAADRAGREFDEKAAKAAESAAKKGSAAQRKAEAAARRAAAAARKAANEIASAQNELTGKLRQLEQASSKGENAPLEERLRAVDVQYQAIYDSLKKLRNLGLKEDAAGRPLEDVEDIVELQKQEIKNDVELKFFEQELKALTEQRKDLVEGINDDQERGLITTAQAFRAVEEINGRLTPGIINAAKGALSIARTINELNPTPQMTAFIDEMTRLINTESNPIPLKTLQADTAREGLEQQETKLNEILSDRNNLVESYNRLAELGLMTDREAREATADAYNRAGPALADQVAKIKETVELMKAQGLITDLVYDNWIAKIQQVNAEAQYVDDRIRQVNQTAQEQIAGGITNAFTLAAESIVGLIGGAKDFGDVLSDVFRAGLQFVADFTKALADVLIQMIAIQAAKAIIGGGTGGLGALFFHGGGLVGRGSGRRTRELPAMAYLGAPKFHGGGGFGLRPNEYTAILERGEEVLTDSDPRHINNGGGFGGGGGQAAPSISQVLLFDEREVAGAMAGSAGQKTFLTFVKKNASTIKQILR